MSYRVTYHEEADGRVVLRYSGDAQMLVDACADEAKANREQFGRHSSAGMRRSMGLRRTMSIDPVVLMEIARQHGISDPFDPAVFAIAKGRDYSKFRCVEDKLLFKRAARVAPGAKIITLGVEKKDPTLSAAKTGF